MVRQGKGWMVTVAMAAVVAAGVWVLAAHLQGAMVTVRQERDTLGLPLFEFQRLHEKGEAVAVDVRDRASYEAGRIAGALHASLEDLEAGADGAAAIGRTVRGRLVVTYCSCPAEASSLRAARALAERGVPARALVGGYPKWVEAGGRIEQGVPDR